MPRNTTLCLITETLQVNWDVCLQGANSIPNPKLKRCGYTSLEYLIVRQIATNIKNVAEGFLYWASLVNTWLESLSMSVSGCSFLP